MKIQSRLMLVIIPVLIIVHGLTALFTNIMSTSALEDQARENAILLSNSYSNQIESKIVQYQNISQDLGSAVITAINIETTLQEVRKRYPQFTSVFYTPLNGRVLELTPYNNNLLNYDMSGIEAWQRAKNFKQPTMSEPGEYFGQRGVVFFAPVLLSFVQNQEPTVEGIVALVLPLEHLIRNLVLSTNENNWSVFITDRKGHFVYHDDPELILSGNITSLSSLQSLDNLAQSMMEQKTGFATYSDKEGRKFFSFSPIPSALWSLGISSTYADIISEITRMILINMIIVFVGIIISLIIMYFVVHRVVQPIEELTALTQKIAGGDRTVLTRLKTGSEIGLLSESINSMVFELRNSQEKLEAIVEERTMELKVTNEELEQTVEELNAANASLGNTRDNLEQMVVERTGQLQKAQNYISNIINSMPSALIGINNDGTISQWNQEAERLMNLSSEEAIDQPIEKIIPRLTMEVGHILNTMKTKKEYESLKNLRKEGDKTIFEDITVYPLIANGVEGAVIRIDDVTDRVLLEESLRQSQKMDAIGQLAGGIAHDFNNMLGGILGGAELLESYLKDNEEAESYLNLIKDSADRAADLTNKLLSFSRKGLREFVPIDVHDAIKKAVVILERTLDKKIQIKTHLDAEQSVVMGDFTQLQSIYLNLGINAGHAMNNGGELIISSKIIELSESYCKTSLFKLNPGLFLETEIQDTGVGIDPDLMDRIFEPFFTTKEMNKGTGLGLASVYGTVQQHKGAVTVYSALERGSVFHVYLPLLSDQLVIKQKPGHALHGKGCILIIDDEKNIRTVAEAILTDLGYDIILANNGKEGLETFKQNQKIIDLVLLDMMMPEMNGKECFIELQKINSQIPVILSSGFSQKSDVEELKKLGLHGFIHKPYHRLELSRIVSKVLNNRPQDKEKSNE